MSESIALAALTFVVSLIYSSVGHGGASGYLALLSFFAISHQQMASSALCLNLLVAGTAFWAFYQAAHFSWKLTWPFTVASVPFAFIGGLVKISPKVYSLLLAIVLIFAALRLLFQLNKNNFQTGETPPIVISIVIGGFIGILSGIVGVGGGIFLSPLLLLFNWADPKKTAATSAFFILVNSMAGLAGRLARHGFELTPVLAYMVFSAFIGGIIGSRLGANHFSGKWLRVILAGVLLLAVFKLLRTVV